MSSSPHELQVSRHTLHGLLGGLLLTMSLCCTPLDLAISCSSLVVILLTVTITVTVTVTEAVTASVTITPDPNPHRNSRPDCPQLCPKAIRSQVAAFACQLAATRVHTSVGWQVPLARTFFLYLLCFSLRWFRGGFHPVSSAIVLRHWPILSLQPLPVLTSSLYSLHSPSPSTPCAHLLPPLPILAFPFSHSLYSPSPSATPFTTRHLPSATLVKYVNSALGDFSARC